MTTLVRFAPSPTGYLHVGNLRTALVNYLFARRTGGRFALRIDDTDTERSKSEYVRAIEEDLRWLGLDWDESFHQSHRFDRYSAAKNTLLASGRLYPCFERAEELEIRRKMQASRGVPPVYDRAALKLSEEEIAAKIARGEKPHYRFLLEHKDIVWNDLVRGECRYHASHISDPVLIREDGVPLYTLASVVDDGETGATHVIRGEDHVTNTAVQVQIFEALGFAPPRFAHLALLKTKEGELSKRTGGSDIRSLRAAGIEPMAINALLARLGTSDAIEPVTSLSPLVESFDFAKFGRAPANYAQSELERLNARILALLPFAHVQARLEALGLRGVDESFWLAVRGNLEHINDALEWWRVAHEEIPVHIEDAEFIALAARHLPAEPWDESSWGTWTQSLSTATGRKGKALFHPLRLALTGRENGPELKYLLPMIGRARALQRLQIQAA